jgi:hypothetical protein
MVLTQQIGPSARSMYMGLLESTTVLIQSPHSQVEAVGTWSTLLTMEYRLLMR